MPRVRAVLAQLPMDVNVDELIVESLAQQDPKGAAAIATAAKKKRDIPRTKKGDL